MSDGTQYHVTSRLHVVRGSNGQMHYFLEPVTITLSPQEEQELTEKFLEAKANDPEVIGIAGADLEEGELVALDPFTGIIMPTIETLLSRTELPLMGILKG